MYNYKAKKQYKVEEEETVASYCTNCRSGEYLYNEDGNRNNYCGQCGVGLDWSETESKEEEGE